MAGQAVREALAELGGMVAALLAAESGGTVLCADMMRALTSAESEARRALALPQSETKAGRIAEINERLNRLIECEYPEPDCTCNRTDVDVFDSSSCDFCDNSSQWNRDRRRAEAAVKDAAFHDIDFLLRAIGQRRDTDGVEIAELVGGITNRAARAGSIPASSTIHMGDVGHVNAATGGSNPPDSTKTTELPDFDPGRPVAAKSIP